MRVYTGTVEGKRKYDSKVVAGTFKQADAERIKMLAAQDAGTYVAPAKQTVKDYCEEWLKGKAGKVSLRTLRDYTGRLAADIYPTLGHLRLDLVTPQHVQRCYDGIAKSPRTVAYSHSVLHQALAQAVQWNVLLRNPADYVELPKREKEDLSAKVLTPEETASFLEKNLGTPEYAFWLLQFTSGLRPEEALALMWQDLDGEWLTVRRTIIEVGKGKYELSEGTKTEGSVRTLSLPQTTVDALKEHRKVTGSIGFMFPSKTGSFLHPSNVRRKWKLALTRAGLSHRKWYITRHTHLSHLLNAGVSPKAVADRSGHSDPTTLLRTYAWTSKELHAGMGGITEGLLFNRPRAVSNA